LSNIYLTLTRRHKIVFAETAINSTGTLFHSQLQHTFATMRLLMNM